MLSSNTTTTTPSREGESTTKSPQTSRKLSASYRSKSSHGSYSADPREDYITKSKAAAARWSGSDRKVAKTRQQSLDKTRREKAALQKVFDLGGVTEKDEAAEEGIRWGVLGDDDFREDFDEALWGLYGEDE